MLHTRLLIFTFLFVSVKVLSTQAAGCTISINKDLTEPQPLVLTPDGSDGSDVFYLPDNGDVITLSEGQLVDLACTNYNLVLDGTSTGTSNGQATCKSGSFSINGLTLPFSAITCSTIPYHTARFTGATCLSNYREIEVGFIVGDRFLRNLRICFDDSVQTTLFSEFNLTKSIAGYQSGYPRPSWIQSSFYSLGSSYLNTLYTRNTQRITINTLLGLDVGSYKYVAETSDLYLARGHLAAKADFVYGSQHRLTFYFVNAAPQWQTFNGQNWNYLEQDVRTFTAAKGLDLIVYTGTHGVTSLPHETTGEDVELYLYIDGTTKGIPVPRIYWKVLYEPITKAGVVFIGVNNPYVLNSSKDVICTDICSQYDWLTWKAANVTLGYSYCCSVEDFRKTVTTFPDIEVVQLLK